MFGVVLCVLIICITIVMCKYLDHQNGFLYCKKIKNIEERLSRVEHAIDRYDKGGDK